VLVLFPRASTRCRAIQTEHSPTENRSVGALARRPLCRFEQARDATRQEKLELVAGAHLRFSDRFLGSFTLESLSLPPQLPRLFALHSDTVARGSDIGVERRSARPSCSVVRGSFFSAGGSFGAPGKLLQALAALRGCLRRARARPYDHTALFNVAPRLTAPPHSDGRARLRRAPCGLPGTRALLARQLGASPGGERRAGDLHLWAARALVDRAAPRPGAASAPRHHRVPRCAWRTGRGKRDLDGADVGTGVGGSGSRTLLWHADGRGMVAQSPTCATGRGGRLARAVLALATGFVTCRRCDVPP